MLTAIALGFIILNITKNKKCGNEFYEDLEDGLANNKQ